MFNLLPTPMVNIYICFVWLFVNIISTIELNQLGVTIFFVSIISHSQMLHCYEFLILGDEAAKTPVFGTKLKRAFLEMSAHVHIKRKSLMLSLCHFQLSLFSSCVFTFYSFSHSYQFHCNHFHFRLFFHVNVSTLLCDMIHLNWTLM